MTELYLFRHGRTEWNAVGRYQGTADIDLDALGEAQAVAVGRRCKEIDPEMIVSSDLRRCAATAARASSATGLELRTDTLLRERDVGEWTGLTRAQVSERWPEDLAAWMNGDDGVRPGGGESVEDVIHRAKKFMATLSGTERVVAVTHAGWIRSVLQWAIGPNMRRSAIGVPSQGSMTVLRMGDDGAVRIEAFNDRGHLLNVEDVDRKAPAAPIY